MVMFDSLVRTSLGPYGAEGARTPNFDRLARHSVTFDRFYAGSLPCIPARRELHTGRYNFLHRSWGPLEPFDDSMPELLKQNGVHSHLVTDHQHYWEDGGATYHRRYNTFEFFRGQEGDTWKGRVDPPPPPPNDNAVDDLSAQDWINRQFTGQPGEFPQTRTFDAGLEFIESNRDSQNWFLQIESFDPHEPFYRPESVGGAAVPTDGSRIWDWPGYHRVIEDQDRVDAMREQYLGLLEYCDLSLGRVLDEMDRFDLWKDTMLIVCTDHGFMLGEHEWWAKAMQPWYEETIHTPFFLWDPRNGRRDERDEQLAQTIDIPATILEVFGLPLPDDMMGEPLSASVGVTQEQTETALFGDFGAHVNITDGRHVYMRAATDPTAALFEYTLMPTRMWARFTPAELRGSELVQSLPFSKESPVLRIPAVPLLDSGNYGTLLFDLQRDPAQEHPLTEVDTELRMIRLLIEAMDAADAPAEQYERLGLPRSVADVSRAHCQTAATSEVAARWSKPPVPEAVFAEDSPLRTRTVAGVLAHAEARRAVEAAIPALQHPAFARRVRGFTLIEAASLDPDASRARLDSLDAELTLIGL